MFEYINERITIKIGIIVICILLLVGSCYASQNTFIAEIIAFIEVFLVILLVAMKKMNLALIAHNFFLACSIEVSTFVYNEQKMLYSYAYLPYVHRYGPFAMEISMLIALIIYDRGKIKIKWKEKTNGWLSKFVKYITILIINGFAMSIVTTLLNDNHVNSLVWYFDSYLRESIYWIILLIDVLLVYLRLVNNIEFAEKLRIGLISLFTAVPFASFLSMVLGFHGNYSYHTNVLLMPLISFYTVGVAIFSLYENYKSVLFYFCAILMFIIQMLMASPLLGKWIIFTISIMFFFLWNMLSRKQFVKFIGITLVLLLAFVFLGNYVLNSNEFLRNKFDQVIGIFRFDSSWISNMSSSPSIRIEEFLNIGVELMHKPWFLLFGKGIGGTTRHWLNWNSWNIVSAFSVEQFSSGIFMEMHETLNVIFLKFGILGFIFFIWTIACSIRSISKSPWVFLGLFWFIFFINSYISLYIMVPAFMLGMFESDGKS